jgi:murein L,D-transpeptidase YafK
MQSIFQMLGAIGGGSRCKALLHWTVIAALATLLPLTGTCWAAELVGQAPAQTSNDERAASERGALEHARSLDESLARFDLKRGDPVLIRIFKEESQLELWMRSGSRFELFAIYAICRWRGTLGPKLFEGDHQSPEGFYSIGQEDLLWQGHWFRAVNISYPNAYDRALGHTGSGILVHGACSSAGCFAMTDQVIDEIFDLVVAAFAGGQQRIQVHVFPFRMSALNLARHSSSQWTAFWRDLEPASELFESTGIPPKVGLCDDRYIVRPGQPVDPQPAEVSDWCGPLTWPGSAEAMQHLLDVRRATAVPPPIAEVSSPPSQLVLTYARLSAEGKIPKPEPRPAEPQSFGPSLDPMSPTSTSLLPLELTALPVAEQAKFLGVRGRLIPGGGAPADNGAAEPAFSCNGALAACRHYMAQQGNIAEAIRAAKAKLAKK